MENSINIELTADIVSAFVGKNSVSVSDLPSVIRSVFNALNDIGQPPATRVTEAAKPTAAQIKKSITTEHLVSFLDGKSYKTLKRHLTTHGMTIADYKARFGLPNDYPTTAPAYSAARSAMAKSLGLGQGGRVAKTVATPSAKGRVKKPA